MTMGNSIYFYGHATSRQWACFSNFYPAPFHAPDPKQWVDVGSAGDPPTYEDMQQTVRFEHTEQYMMYCKARLFSDSVVASAILKETKPAKCKALGRGVRDFEDGKWSLHREKIMEEALWWKFGGGGGALGGQGRQDLPEIGRILLSTGDQELVEASPRDRIWGIGYAKADAEGHRHDWGLNLLGKALSRVRERLRELEDRRGNEGDVS